MKNVRALLVLICGVFVFTSIFASTLQEVEKYITNRGIPIREYKDFKINNHEYAGTEVYKMQSKIGLDIVFYSGNDKEPYHILLEDVAGQLVCSGEYAWLGDINLDLNLKDVRAELSFILLLSYPEEVARFLELADKTGFKPKRYIYTWKDQIYHHKSIQELKETSKKIQIMGETITEEKKNIEIEKGGKEEGKK